MGKENKVKKKPVDISREIEFRYVKKSDLGNRLLSFMLDLVVMLSPMMIWNIILLMVLGSIVSISGIFFINVMTGIMMILSIFFLNRYISVQTKGQSLGMYMYKFKVIRSNGKMANKRQIWMRELLGCDIPFVVLFIFLNIFGVMIYWMINGIVILVDKRHRSIIDFITKTCVIVVLGEKQENEIEKVLVQQAPIFKEELEIEKPWNHMDLHIHSNFSANGKYNVEEIFQEAKKKNIHTISITDMNTIKQNAIALRMSELYHVNYVPGIEIDCELHGQRIRILGYFIQFQSDLYATIENESLVHEKNASIERIRKFERYLGKKIAVDDLLKNNRFQSIPGELIAAHVLNDPYYRDCEVLKPYLVGKLEQPYRQLYKDYFDYGESCHVAVKYPDVKDILDVIELTGGIAVLANPKSLLSQPEMICKLVSMGIQGIEVFQPQHTRKEMATILKIAKDEKLFITCGSNFYHKGNKNIGECNCPLEAEALVDSFIKAKL